MKKICSKSQKVGKVWENQQEVAGIFIEYIKYLLFNIKWRLIFFVTFMTV